MFPFTAIYINQQQQQQQRQQEKKSEKERNQGEQSRWPRPNATR